MFDPATIQVLAREHGDTLRRLHGVEQDLNQRFHRVGNPVRALVLSVLAGEPLLFIGPPGTAKSRLIRAFCEVAGMSPAREHSRGEQADYFEYLLTPFTEPSELFGYYDIGRLQKGELVRMNEGRMMQNARVVYLDEVFNGSSAILNTILSFLNERVFHDRGVPRPVAMECLFASTNHVPETPELLAVYDRFLLRCPLGNIEADPAEIDALLDAGWRDTYRDEGAPAPGHDLLRALAEVRAGLRRAVTDGRLAPAAGDSFAERLADAMQTARQYDLSAMSNRRLVKITHLVLLHRVYRHAVDPEREGAELNGDDLAIIPTFAFDRPDEEIAAKLVARAHRWRPSAAAAEPPPATASVPPPAPATTPAPAAPTAAGSGRIAPRHHQTIPPPPMPPPRNP